MCRFNADKDVKLPALITTQLHFIPTSLVTRTACTGLY